MKKLLLLLLAILPAGCANFIREADAVVTDAVPGTIRVGLDELRYDNALVTGKIRFTCQQRLYSITNIYETPYGAQHEIYEIPMGILTIIPSFLWYGFAEIFSGFAVDSEHSTSALDWSVAGLNPFLNVEEGMFGERYRIRERDGSRRPQEGSQPQPYDAVVAPRESLAVTFEGGTTIYVPVDEEVGMTLNLVEVAHGMPSETTLKIDIEVLLIWNDQAKPVQKTIQVYLDDELAKRLWEIRDASGKLYAATTLEERDAALEEIANKGFSREAAMARDRLPPLTSTTDVK